jgi:hypothetical protein
MHKRQPATAATSKDSIDPTFAQSQRPKSSPSLDQVHAQPGDKRLDPPQHPCDGVLLALRPCFSEKDWDWLIGQNSFRDSIETGENSVRLLGLAVELLKLKNAI